MTTSLPLSQHGISTMIDFAAVVASVNLPDIAIKAGVALKSNGNEYVGLCPLHQERRRARTGKGERDAGVDRSWVPDEAADRARATLEELE